MSRRPDNEIEALRENWKGYMKDAEYRCLSTKQRAALAGVTEQTIGRWEKDVSDFHPEQWEQWKVEARTKYAKHLPEIDMAMIKKAKGGGVDAALYVAQRFEGWSPKQINENLNKDEFSGLSAAEKLAKAKEIAARLAGKVDLGVVRPSDGEKRDVTVGGNG